MEKTAVTPLPLNEQRLHAEVISQEQQSIITQAIIRLRQIDASSQTIATLEEINKFSGLSSKQLSALVAAKNEIAAAGTAEDSDLITALANLFSELTDTK